MKIYDDFELKIKYDFATKTMTSNHEWIEGDVIDTDIEEVEDYLSVIARMLYVVESSRKKEREMDEEILLRLKKEEEQKKLNYIKDNYLEGQE